MSERVLTAERLIQDLSPDELSEFANWFAEFRSLNWEIELERDSVAGHLDTLIAKAHQSFDSGVVREI